MHELSIAINVIEIAKEYAEKANAKVIHEIEIEVGDMSGVVLESLEFALDCSVKNTILENTKRIITKVVGKARCNNCSNEFEINDLYYPCPKCNQFNSEVIQGKELRVKSINID